MKSGHLWDANGTLLASVNFATESDSGWQEATLGQPVQLATDTIYVASYFAPQGGYAATRDYFTGGPTVSGPLTAPADGNGVYTYAGGPAFPTTTYWRQPNYWADLVFVPGTTSSPGGGATTAGKACSRTVRDRRPTQALIARPSKSGNASKPAPPDKSPHCATSKHQEARREPSRATSGIRTAHCLHRSTSRTSRTRVGRRRPWISRCSSRPVSCMSCRTSLRMVGTRRLRTTSRTVRC